MDEDCTPSSHPAIRRKLIWSVTFCSGLARADLTTVGMAGQSGYGSAEDERAPRPAWYAAPRCRPSADTFWVAFPRQHGTAFSVFPDVSWRHHSWTATVDAETRFPTGTIIATRRAGDALVQAGVAGLELVDRHVRGDWGDISPEGREENSRALREAGRIISSYTLTTGVRVLVLTEGDRSATTILLPEEYPLD